MSQAAFWKAICAEPDDDTPRLVFADWLDEQGDANSAAQAEFIRAQIELTQLEAWSERAISLKARAQVLLRDHREVWLRPLMDWLKRGQVIKFVRGFPYSHSSSVSAFQKHAAQITKNTVLQDFDLAHFASTALPLVLKHAVLGRVRTLRCHAERFDAVYSLFNSPRLTALRELHLTTLSLGPMLSSLQVASLLQTPSVLRCEKLQLQLVFSGDDRHATEQLSLLAEIPFTQLRELQVTGSPMLADRIAALLNADSVRELRAFRTARTLADRELAGFLDAPEIPSLRTVRFAVNTQDTDLLWRVLNSPVMRHVVDLTIEGLREEDFLLLSRSPLAPQLRRLNVFGGTITPRALWEAGATGHFRDLRALQLALWCETQEHQRLLADVRGFDNLQRLDFFAASNFSPLALDMLNASKHFPKLQYVRVPRNITSPHVHEGLYTPERVTAFVVKYASRFTVLV